MAEKKCNKCGTDKTPTSVPYVVHESTVSRMERIIKKQWIALIVAICLLFASFGLFVWSEIQYETIDYSYDYSQDGQGTNIIGNDNEVDNGAKIENTSKSEKETKQ